MGQKVNPIGFRLGFNRAWDSRWYAKPNLYSQTIIEDMKIRRELLKMEEVASSDVSKIEISRNPQRITVSFHTAKPGSLIGKAGANIEKLTAKIATISKKKTVVKVVEVARPAADATLIASSIARQLANRGGYKRILKKAVSDALRDGALGIKIRVSGRLNGAEIARSDSIKDGRIPLHTLRSKIDYACAAADTSYGAIGVKVWIYNGESLDDASSKRSDAGKLVKKNKPQGVNNA